jgi:hypothetical protein
MEHHSRMRSKVVGSGGVVFTGARLPIDSCTAS